jgi:hypothetical protein
MRIRDVSITEEGRAAFERVWPMMHARFQTLFDGVEEEEYRAFTATLLKILRNVAKLPELARGRSSCDLGCHHGRVTVSISDLASTSNPPQFLFDNNSCSPSERTKPKKEKTG